MTEAVIVALITGGLSLLGVIFTNMASNRKIQSQLSTSQAVTDTQLKELTREVREHNNFAKRMPVVEEHVKEIKDEINTLKSYHMQPKG